MAAPRVLTLEDCERVARRHFGRQDARVSHWRERRLAGDKPVGYLGEHRVAEVHATVDGREERVSVFVKTMPANVQQAALIAETGAFRKEVLFYSRLLPDWEARGLLPKASAAESSGDGEREKACWSCRCYLARADMIVLEDVSVFGYKSDSPRNTYDFDHALLALKTLAQLHATSLIYEEERSAELGRPYRLGEEFPELFVDTLFTLKEGHPGEKTTEAGVVGLVECAKLLPVCQADAAVMRRVEQRLPDVLRQMVELVKASTRFRNVVCHSDLWQNNLLVRRGPGGRPTGVVLVDWQLLRYAPPAQDVFDLLHLTTRRELRRAREGDLLDAYYAALEAALRRRGLEAARLLPRAVWDASLEEQRRAGRLSASMALHFLLCDPAALGSLFGDPAEYDRAVFEGAGRARLVCSSFQRDEGYRERMQEALMELLEEDVLP